jgi:hypothetical protein
MMSQTIIIDGRKWARKRTYKKKLVINSKRK